MRRLAIASLNSDEPQDDGHKTVVANVGLIKTFHIGQASLGYVRHFISGEGDRRGRARRYGERLASLSI